MLIDYTQGGKAFNQPSCGYTYIYELYDPADLMPRYIGKAVYPRNRYRRHLEDGRNGKAYHSCRWVNSLLKQGRNPVMMLIAFVAGDGSDKERELIETYQQAGFDLTNIAAGGSGGASGIKRSDATKRKTAESLRRYYDRVRAENAGKVPATPAQAVARKANKFGRK